MVGDDLYKREYGQPLLKCVTAEQAQYIIKELHEGICGYHSGARTMATRVLRAGYFWPTIGFRSKWTRWSHMSYVILMIIEFNGELELGDKN